VLLTNPRLVQTGLDLIDFPSVVWAEVDYSVYVLRQASRRSWRIGQRHPVEVTFLVYADTLQADALGLVAAKTRASLMVEGELPEEGLAALDGDGGDVHLALARRLAGSAVGADGRAQSLEALFAEARRNEEQADELLVEGGWEVEPELPPGPIPFPIVPAPPEPGTLDGLPLFATAAAVAAPAAGPVNGKVVTLDELVGMVRRRRSRPKPVSEGQLALFAS
jgi:hypothetical protein